MSTVTYSSPIQEFFANMSAAATAAVVNVFEMTPPRGFKIVVQAFEGTVGTAGLVFTGRPATVITGAATTPVATMTVINPFQVMTGVLNVGTAAAAPGGYVFLPTFRMPFNQKTVVDSVGDQRLIWSAITVNEANSINVKGWIVPAVFSDDDIRRL